jgi:hypothetical protein
MKIKIGMSLILYFIMVKYMEHLLYRTFLCVQFSDINYTYIIQPLPPSIPKVFHHSKQKLCYH